MSKQLTLSAAASVLAMSLFAISATGNATPASYDMGAKAEASAPNAGRISAALSIFS